MPQTIIAVNSYACSVASLNVILYTGRIMGMTRSEAGKLGYEKSKHLLAKLTEERYAARRQEYAKHVSKCKFCSKDLPFKMRKYKYCSQTCAAIFANSERNKTRVYLKLHTCSECDKKINRDSKMCRLHYNISRCTTDLSSLKSEKARRRALLRMRKHRCEICKMENWNGEQIPLVMDHVDGDSSNNASENLRLICPNCDALTPFYKGRNRGRGRAQRRKRAGFV